MELVLTLSGNPTSSAESLRRLSHGALTIGRGEGNDWVLDDPSRAMSRRHCRIEKREDGFWLVDESRNGSVINGRCVKGVDQAVRLANGDRLKLGAFELSATVEDDQPAPAEQPSMVDPFASLPEAEPADVASHDDPLSISQIISRNWSDQEASSRSRDALEAAEEPDGSEARPHEGFVPPHREHYAIFKPTKPPAADAAGAKAPDPFAIADVIDQPAPAPSGPRATVPSSLERENGSSVAIDGLEAFLKGAGLDQETLGLENTAATFERLGATFAAMADGFRHLLQARAAIKGEAGLEQTRIGAERNNPLKSAVRPDEATSALLTHKGPGYLDPDAALSEAIADLKNHEVAMLAGLRAAVNDVMARFDPAHLEAELREDGVFRNLAAGGQSARCWSRFKDRYAEIRSRAEQRWMGDFDQVFSRAYNESANRS